VRACEVAVACRVLAGMPFLNVEALSECQPECLEKAYYTHVSLLLEPFLRATSAVLFLLSHVSCALSDDAPPAKTSRPKGKNTKARFLGPGPDCSIQCACGANRFWFLAKAQGNAAVKVDWCDAQLQAFLLAQSHAHEDQTCSLSQRFHFGHLWALACCSEWKYQGSWQDVQEGPTAHQEAHP